MLMNDAPMPVGMPFAPYTSGHTLNQRYMHRQLVDDIAGEDIPQGMAVDAIVCASDLPLPARIVRPGTPWPRGLLLPKGTLVVVVDHDNVIMGVGTSSE
ncbi:hypothetical protein GGF46_003954 [Coemansia sp. RSA 552]|nr:hypothetical protein GGF46_003954 [Coemansia sp. RSA 552]